MEASKSQGLAEHVAVAVVEPKQALHRGEPQGEDHGGEAAPGLLSPGLRARR